MENQFGKLYELHLHAGFDGEKTILKDVRFTAPFKILRPFYESKDRMTVMLMMASAGIMAGDRQCMHILVDTAAKMDFVSQAYEKVHRMEEGEAQRQVYVEVKRGASLYYTPLPILPFRDSAFSSETEVELEDETSGFLMTEVLACGRASREEKFQYRWYKNRVNIRQAGKLIYRDNTCFEPKNWDMSGFGMYEGYTHLANMIICNEPKTEEWVSRVREFMDTVEDIDGGVTQNGENLTVIRILGKSGQKLLDVMRSIQAM